LGKDPNAVEETHRIIDTRKEEVETIGAAIRREGKSLSSSSLQEDGCGRRQ